MKHSRTRTETVEASAVVRAGSALTQSPGRLLRRADAARRLGVSVSTLRRMDGNVVHPVVDEHGAHLYDEAQLDAVRVKYRRTEQVDPNAIDGETAAAAFSMFEEGKGPVDVVCALRVVPDLVEALHAQWARMKGGLFLDEDVRTRMVEMALSRGSHELTAAIRIRTGQDLLEAWMKHQDASIDERTMEAAQQCRACMSKCSLRPGKAMYCEECARKRFSE